MSELTKEMELAKVVRLKDQFDSLVLQYNVVIKEDGVQIAENIATEVLRPDCDIDTIEDDDVKAAAQYYWTAEKIEAYTASLIN